MRQFERFVTVAVGAIVFLSCMSLGDDDDSGLYPMYVLPPGCPPGFVQIAGAASDKCFKLVLNSTGPTHYINSDFVLMSEAFIECTLQQAFLARPENIAQANAIKGWLDTNYGDLFTSASPYGVWTGYRRNEFPVGNLTYSTEVRPERIDPANYYDLYLDCPRVVMNPDLWRDAARALQDQPNDKGNNQNPDVFDERCVAMKKVSDPSNIGLDDYDCEDGAVHATLCEACFVEVPQ